MKSPISMSLAELKEELKMEKAWLRECEMNARLSKAEIEHLGDCIRIKKEKEIGNGK